MKTYRLYVGHRIQHDPNPVIQREDVENAIRIHLEDHGFSGATLLHATGLWEGKSEPSTVIEILTIDHQPGRINALARGLAAAMDQESVLVTATETAFDFIRHP